jgi:hypothetical protein
MELWRKPSMNYAALHSGFIANFNSISYETSLILSQMLTALSLSASVNILVELPMLPCDELNS